MLKVFSLKNQKKDANSADLSSSSDTKTQQPKASAAQIRITRGLFERYLKILNNLEYS
jgi:hypothetical protein